METCAQPSNKPKKEGNNRRRRSSHKKKSKENDRDENAKSAGACASKSNNSAGSAKKRPNKPKTDALIPNDNRSSKSNMNSHMFQDYWRPELVQHALDKGILISGALRIHQKNYKEAYVSTKDGSDVCIQGIPNRNRSLHGDLVAVDLLPEMEWKVLQEKFRDFSMLEEQLSNCDKLPENDSKLANNDVGTGPSTSEDKLKSTDSETKQETDVNSDEVQEQVGNSEQKKKKTRRGNRGKGKQSKDDGDDDVDIVVEKIVQLDIGKKEENTPAILDKQAKANLLRRHLSSTCEEPPLISIPELQRIYPDSWQNFVQKTGRVVYIFEEKHTRLTVGQLKLFPDKNPNFALFAPMDPKVPRIKIPRDQCPKDFWTRPQDFQEFMYLAKIVRWDQVSYAMGQLKENIGSNNDVDARTRGMLLENGVDYEEFSADIDKDLPSLPFVIPPDEIAKRRDFRKECVFTIDPLTARDLDDALSIEELNDGTFRVGVHIADVTYFVKPETTLDREAERRATSVYLVQKVVPMLPRTLCEHLCSLNPGEDRLTFSVEWIMNSNGEILKSWFGRSVIRSAVKLAYEHAQDMIDRPDRDWSVDELPAIESPWNAKVISDKVNMLQKLAIKLRTRREENGALRLDQPKVCFSLDQESGLPQGYKLYEQRSSNKLIEEYMLLANISVATKIQETFPNIALLRCHPEPKMDLLDKFVDQLQKYGVDLDSSSSHSLQRTLLNYKPVAENEHQTKGIWQAVISILSKSMCNAEYFCTGILNDVEKFRHYALSVPLYTHFTSPIRRYPDVIVHRLLDAALKHHELKWSPTTIQRIANHCNDRKLAAKTISDKSAELFLCLFIRQCGPLVVHATVGQVMDYAVDCTLFDMGITRRVYVNKNEDIQSYEYVNYEGKLTLVLKWKGQNEPQRLQMFSDIELSLEANDKSNLDFTARLIKPTSS